jgi:hypothetical protein
MKAMRENSLALVDVGRALEVIERDLRSIRATSAVEDHNAVGIVRNMRLAAQRMAKALGDIERNLMAGD